MAQRERKSKPKETRSDAMKAINVSLTPPGEDERARHRGDVKMTPHERVPVEPHEVRYPETPWRRAEEAASPKAAGRRPAPKAKKAGRPEQRRAGPAGSAGRSSKAKRR